jgi:chromosome segregation ATPase
MCGLIRASVLACGVAVFALTTGCASEGGRTEESQKTTTSLKETRQELVRAKTEVNDVNTALSKLQAGGNLDQSFKQYTAAVKDVQAAGQRARERAQAWRDNSRQYVAKWEKEMEQVSSPELRAGAAARRQRVKDNFEDVVTSGRSVREAYQPYLKSLQDIQRALASDLNPAGVAAAAPAMDKAKADGAALNERLDALIAKLDTISAGMSGAAAPQGKAAS